MPALPPVLGVVRVDFHYTDGTDLNAMNRMFFEYTGSLSSTDAETWVQACRSAWGASPGLKNVIGTNCSLVRTVLTDLTSATSAQAEDDTGVGGNLSGTFVGAGTACVVKFIIARRYRGGHPRIYLPAQVHDQMASQQAWLGSYLGGVQTNTAATIALIISGAPSAVGIPRHVNVSYYQGFHNVTFPSGRTRPVPLLRSGGPVVDPVIAIAVNPKVASQRRRNLQNA